MINNHALFSFPSFVGQQFIYYLSYILTLYISYLVTLILYPSLQLYLPYSFILYPFCQNITLYASYVLCLPSLPCYLPLSNSIESFLYKVYYKTSLYFIIMSERFQKTMM